MSTGVGFAVGFPQLGCENPHQLVRIMDFTPVLRADCTLTPMWKTYSGFDPCERIPKLHTSTAKVLVCYMHILMRIYYGCLPYTLKGEIRGDNLQQKLTCGGFLKSHLRSLTVQKNPALR